MATLQNVIERVNVLEAFHVNETEDYNDPPLHLLDANNDPIDPNTIETIPDIVKNLPNFTGDPSELSSWITDAQDLINLYKTTATSTIPRQNKFHMICKTIRRKIRGEANDALVSSDVNINWNSIKKTLQTYYGEKRDLGTLDYQLMNCYQKGRSLEIYYDDVNRYLSLIANLIKTDDKYSHPEAKSAMIDMYNEKAIDAFMRGLDGDIGKFLKNYRPDSLAAAYAYCITFQNIEFRKSLTKPNIPHVYNGPRNQIPNQPRIPPRLPPRIPMRFPPQPFRNPYMYQPDPRNFPQKPPFQPFWDNPRFQNQQFRQPNNGQPFSHQPFRNNGPPIPVRNPKPVPMEVDSSIRSGQINYGNRPQNSFRHPLKRPRLNNITTEEDQEYFEYPENFYHLEDQEYYFDNGYIPEQYPEEEETIPETIPEENESKIELNFLG